jgi:GDP-mannose 6-dehydrogenase
MSKISIFGLGYVGTVSAACFAHNGHKVIGVDKNETKIDIIKNGRSPVIEKGLEPIIADEIRRGRLITTGDEAYAIMESNISFICVGTPSKPNGSLDLKYIKKVIQEIGKNIADKKTYHIIVVRSTILPGTTEDVIIPILENESGKKAGIDFGVVFNPEFLRESSAVNDFFNPARTVIVAVSKKDFDMVAECYKDINAPLIMTEIRTAEMVKYSDNIFHSLKVCFSNEIGNVCKALGVDSHDVMDIFSQDTKLNLSPVYLKPGFAFGGSCLPKDLRALTYCAKTLDLDLPLINSIIPSNEFQIKNALQRVLDLGKKRIGILGFAFKAGTDDLRESPVVKLIELLLGKGFSIKIYDQKVSLAKLFGANKEFIEKKIPHISKLMVEEIDEVLKHSEVVIIGNRSIEFSLIFPKLKPEQIVLDLVRITRTIESPAKYDGLCW